MGAIKPGGGGGGATTAAALTDVGAAGLAVVQSETAAAVRTAAGATAATSGLLSALPASASEGDSYFCTDTLDVFFWRNGAWRYGTGAPYVPLPTAAGATPVLWLRADLGVTSSSGVVSAWASQGSITASAAQSTSGKRPTLVDAKTLNGKPSLYFDGSDDYLDVPYNASWSPSDMTLFLVGDLYNDAAMHVVGPPHVDGSHTSPFFVWTFYTSSGTDINIRVGSSSLTASGHTRPAGKYALTEPKIFTYTLSASARVVRAGGVQILSGAGATPTNTNNTPLRIGANGAGGEALKGHLHEVAIFSSVLSAAQIAAVESQLALRWMIPLQR